MKILHAIQSADPTGGGPIESIKQLAIATNAYHQHSVVTIDSPFAPFLREFPLEITALGPGSVLGYSARFTPWVRERAHAFDCVLIHGLWRYVSFGTWRALRLAKTPYLVMTHGMLDPFFKHNSRLKHIKKWLFWPWTEYRVLKNAAAVIFSCEEERMRARESFWLYRCRETVVMHAISSPIGDDRAQRALFLRTFPQLMGKRVLLFLNRIHPLKGCDLLLSAFAKIADQDPRLHLVMAGPCSAQWDKRLRRQAQLLDIDHRITWTGMLTGDIKWGAFHSAEAFVLPSHLESFGVSVVEALACGVPVLISNKVQIWREIDAERAGIIESDSLAGTETLLRRWAALSPVERNQMHECARHCFASRFEPRRAAEKFSRIVEEAVSLT